MNVPKKLDSSDHGGDDFAARWDRIRKKLRAELGEETYMSWFASLQSPS